MKTYTIPFLIFHMTVVISEGLPWLPPKLERLTAAKGPSELELSLGRLSVFLTPGRVPAL